MAVASAQDIDQRELVALLSLRKKVIYTNVKSLPMAFMREKKSWSSAGGAGRVNGGGGRQRHG